MKGILELRQRIGVLEHACANLSAALSEIDYLFCPPNCYELSDYDTHCESAMVLARVKDLIREAQRAQGFTQ